VETFEVAEAAERAGLSVEELRRLVQLGILMPDAEGRFTPGDVRRAGLVSSLATAGIPLDGLGAAMQSGQVSLDFLDEPSYERFSALSVVTFADLAERTGVPVDLLMLIREATGSNPPTPDDRVRDGELPFAAFIEFQVKAGFNPIAIARLLRVAGDSLRRLAESESAWWNSEVMAPAVAAGKRPDDTFGADFVTQMTVLSEQAVIELYRLQQTKTWTANIIEGMEVMLTAAGLHSRLKHPPAMCFLDIAGYTRLTQERGDAAAADLAEQLGRLVQRTSVKYGGRPVKWLGDGVMFYFPNPGPGVVAALEMVEGVAEAGLPPAHVGLHAGPVIFQEGDYYGATVNMASRIADYARPGEVLVSQEVVDASSEAAVVFREIGPVELKGMSDVTRLHAASRAG
jgi:adenylate cyclase